MVLLRNKLASIKFNIWRLYYDRNKLVSFTYRKGDLFGLVEVTAHFTGRNGDEHAEDQHYGLSYDNDVVSLK